jgi:hypothetical protein
MAEASISAELSDRGDGWTALVRVDEGGTQTQHRVTVRRPTFDELSTGVVSPEELVLASFRFLLEREPKESILREFDLDVIGRYFTEYRRAIGDYFDPRA